MPYDVIGALYKKSLFICTALKKRVMLAGQVENWGVALKLTLPHTTILR